MMRIFPSRVVSPLYFLEEDNIFPHSLHQTFLDFDLTPWCRIPCGHLVAPLQHIRTHKLLSDTHTLSYL